MMKIFEADLKRLNGIIVSYKEKKPDLTQEEIDKRNEIINRLRDAFKTLKFDLDQQTNIFENGTGYKYNTKRVDISVVNDLTNDEFQVADNLQTDDPIIDGKKKLSKEVTGRSVETFDKSLDVVHRQLENLEKQFLMNDLDIDEAV